MIGLEESVVATRAPDRAVLARERAQLALAALADCQLCAHHCGVNRLAGERGMCHAGTAARVFSAQVEVGDEMELLPTFAIALSGCDLRCSFCITGAESWNPRAGEALCPVTLAARAKTAMENGAQTAMILGGEPTIHLPAALEIVAALPPSLRLIWKTNAHGTALARGWLDGLFDVWLADYKFGNDNCAERLASVPRYQDVVRENLVWASHNSELIVRHLLMPGHVDCCWEPIARWLAANLPSVKVSLRSGFWPAWRATNHPELSRPFSLTELRSAWTIAGNYGLRLIE
ncbi:MAG TPA: radical SAM protein [Verrucomicrobiae bacterium]|nr:radical SAM protein [Verrucomicrobiae bacterium]